ncbi:SgcJ/EcaC family oxidoreductase [Paludisphaera rhizosphaerae]|uniref:SgcJ/EcaC family oxidoreductase n=1 Tax=Paludisphaera rhizosphaerae TaxID=2711216 RepID=UPI0013EC7097|nr:nuclear transport factor 2 family protein [Paludisphaera rhizosphaerae]
MRQLTIMLACGVSLLGSRLVQAEDGNLKALGETGTAFVNAYNAKDAKALAALWVENADYRDDTGMDVHGRDAVQQAYGAVFTEHPDWKLDLQNVSSRQVTPTIAIQDGIAAISPPPAGRPGPNCYTATLVLQDGKWMIASVRELQVAVASNYPQLQVLEWMIGDWVVESPKRTSESTVVWTKNKNFIKRTFRITSKDEKDSSVTTGMQLIGFDPASGEIRSWLFDSEGGFAASVFTAEDNRLVGQTTNILSDGSSAHSTDVLTRISDNEFSVHSTNRSIEGESVEDGDEVHVKRVPAMNSVAKAK